MHPTRQPKRHARWATLAASLLGVALAMAVAAIAGCEAAADTSAPGAMPPAPSPNLPVVIDVPAKQKPKPKSADKPAQAKVATKTTNKPAPKPDLKPQAKANSKAPAPRPCDPLPLPAAIAGVQYNATVIRLVGDGCVEVRLTNDRVRFARLRGGEQVPVDARVILDVSEEHGLYVKSMYPVAQTTPAAMPNDSGGAGGRAWGRRF